MLCRRRVGACELVACLVGKLGRGLLRLLGLLEGGLEHTQLRCVLLHLGWQRGGGVWCRGQKEVVRERLGEVVRDKSKGRQLATRQEDRPP